MDKQERLPLGVVVERRKIDNPWQDYSWRPVAVIPGAAPSDPEAEWLELGQGDDWVDFHAGTLELELFRKETEAYRVNLSQDPPRVFVGLHHGADLESRHDVVPFLVTASPYEAQDYLDSGEEIVEAVTMPPAVVAFVQAFVDQHHVDEPFYKRKRKRHQDEPESFVRQAPVLASRRGNGRGSSEDGQ